MQRKLTILIIVLLILIPATLVFAQAGDFTVDWWTIDNGGGMSAGGGFSISDTIGQPDAGDMSGGGYTISGGFWDETHTGGLLYLPVVVRNFSPCSALSNEQEPNNSASEANPICLGSQVAGAHDGSQGTGDLFDVYLSAGKSIEITLDTGNDSGVQLLLYREEDSGLALVGQDTISPFSIQHTTQADDQYFIYVYSDPAANNTAAYTVGLREAAAAFEQTTLELSPVITPPPTPGE